MTREEAIEILKYLIPIPHRGDGKSTSHLLQTNALAMAIKALEQEPCKVSEYDKDHIWYKGRQYISLRRFLEVITEPKAKWIPVSERLPEFNGRYLTSLPSRLIHEEYNVMILNFAKSLHGVPNKEAWYEVDSNMVLNEVPGVIAWMPLPEPYKSESEKVLNTTTFCGPSDPDYADKEAMSFRQWLFNGFGMTVEQFESSTTAYGKKFFHNQYLKYLSERNAITTGKAIGVAE